MKAASLSISYNSNWLQRPLHYRHCKYIPEKQRFSDNFVVSFHILCMERSFASYEQQEFWWLLQTPCDQEWDDYQSEHRLPRRAWLHILLATLTEWCLFYYSVTKQCEVTRARTQDFLFYFQHQFIDWISFLLLIVQFLIPWPFLDMWPELMFFIAYDLIS